jgi:ribonuclease P protein component
VATEDLTGTEFLVREQRSTFHEETCNEQENISAEHDAPQAHPWLPHPHEDQERSGHHPPPPRQGSQEIGRLGFSRSNRLLKRSDFLACYDRGRRLHTTHFTIFVRPRPEGGTWRLGLAVTKKIGSAVRRNRVKRVLREFFRLNQTDMPPAVDVVVVAKRNLEPRTIDLASASKELTPIMSRIRSLARAKGPAPAPESAGE